MAKLMNPTVIFRKIDSTRGVIYRNVSVSSKYGDKTTQRTGSKDRQSELM